VSTAKSAAQSQPNTHSPSNHQPRRLPRLVQLGLSVLIGFAVIVPAQTISAPSAAASSSPSCPGWNSTTQPPDYIRVLRRHSGQVDRVPFKKYVVTVLGKEWPSYLPQAVIQAGAVAVKQFAWFHALGNGRVSRHGQCFDVTDGVGDQLYKPNKARIRPDHYAAVAATWGVRLLKNGSLFMTGYRSGIAANCGRDANGWKLYARSAVRCANRGDGFMTILRIYYGPVALVGDNGGNANAAPASSGSVTVSMDVSPTYTTATAVDGTATTSSDQTAVTAQAGTSDGVGVPDISMPDTAPAPASNPAPDPASNPAPDLIPIGARAFTAA
jgi:Stage II sporulation protein